MKKLILIASIGFLFAFDFPSVTNTFSSRTLAKSSQVNANFSDVVNGMKGSNKVSVKELYINQSGSDSLILDNNKDITARNETLTGTLGVSGVSTIATANITHLDAAGGEADLTSVTVSVGVIATANITHLDAAGGEADLDYVTASVGVITTLGGAMDANDENITNIDVNSGAIDGTVIGAAVSADATFNEVVMSSMSYPIKFMKYDTGSTETNFFSGLATAATEIIMPITMSGATQQFIFEVTAGGRAQIDGVPNYEVVFEKNIFVGYLASNILVQGNQIAATYDGGGRLSIAIAAVGSNNQVSVTATYTGTVISSFMMTIKALSGASMKYL